VGNRMVIFSGTAAQVEETFHPALHLYEVDGVEHVAMRSTLRFPRRWRVGWRRGVAARLPQGGQRTARKAMTAASPEYSSGATNYLFPADWATIYDLNSLYAAGVTGKGSTIAIVGRSNIVLSDVSLFRSTSGLPANQPSVVLVSANPGLLSGDQDESTLDVEWSGANSAGGDGEVCGWRVDGDDGWSRPVSAVHCEP